MQPNPLLVRVVHRHENVLFHGLPGNRLVKGQANKRHTGGLPGSKPDMPHLGTFGNKAVLHRFGKRGIVFGPDAGIYSDIIACSGF